MMLRPCAALLAALLVSGFAGARAESVMDRVARTGVLDAGTRSDAIPLAFRGPDNNLQGLAVDILHEIAARLEIELGRSVKLNLLAITPVNRVELIEDGTIVIECGITTPTWAREKRVDFSVPFFENGTRVLAFRNAARSMGDLGDKRIGAIRGSSTLGILRANLPAATVIEIPDMEVGIEMLLDGELDGVANIGVVLRALIEKLDVKNQLLLLPRSGALDWESSACLLPQDDSRWRDFVNRVLFELLDGVDEFRGAYVDLYERWLGPQGPIYYPLDDQVSRRLAEGLMWLP
ncbi:MAG TPA: transporter substrate-binding domain-containing protein [Geminicoccaceae bacterium]|nr:transporter substrate-binding domain-containing protein [Geminicoccus sp.]HMU50296.1 transporter substrate-binding domain-containing protein [Geminicoccaceae bacterium]